MKDNENKQQQCALITGAASGLGKMAANYLLECGLTVFACDREYKENSREKNMHFVSMDVTNDTSVKSAFDYIKTITQKLDIVSSFAGIISAGALLETDNDEALRIFNVNVLGAHRVNKAAFELVRRAKGRYINISSEYGILNAVPFYTLYPATKHALEMYNIGLRRELKMFGIKVVCIRPGAFSTNIINDFSSLFGKAIEKTELYKTRFDKMKALMGSEFNKAKKTTAFIKTFKKAAFSKKPKFYYKANNSFKMKLLNILPEKLQDKLIYNILIK